MSDRRTHRWLSGRLISTSAYDFWQISRTVQDPPIPNLPLETPAEAPATVDQIATVGSRSAYRRSATNRQLRQPIPVVTTAQVEASTDEHIGDPLRTRYSRGRTFKSVGWSASLAPTQAAPAFPFAAVFGQRVTRRRSTERELQAVAPLEWKYIAPTVAAVIPAPKVIKVEFRRELRVVQPLALYPATPPTGPPYPSWLAAAAFRVSHDKWLVQAPEQDSYHATPVVPVDGNSTEAPFETRRIRGRKRLTLAEAPVYPQAATPFQWTPNDAPETLKRRETARRLVEAAYPPVYPQPATPPTVEFAAVSPVRSRRRRGRKLLRSVDLIGVEAAPPVTYPGVVSAFTPVKAIRRKSLGQGFVTVDVVSGQVPATNYFPAFVPSGWFRRAELNRRHQQATDAPSKPQTQPVPAQPQSAFRLAQANLRDRVKRTLRVSVGPLHVEAAPPPAPGEGCYIPPFRRRRR